jgi:hypothetical protein
MQQKKRYRVAQWATGHTGMRCLRTVIEHPQYDLVGLYVYSDAKVGRDAGDICGTKPTGVIATRDIKDIIAAKPDCVIYMPLLDYHSIDDICRLLESGANIVTNAPHFYHPPSLAPDIRRRLEAACERGGTSLYCTGPGPGFISEDLPLTLTRMERRLDRLTIAQFADLSDRNSPDFITHFFGIDPATADMSDVARRSATTDGISLRQLADALGVPLDDVTATAIPAVATKTVKIGVTTIKAGTVGAWRIPVTGIRGGKPFLEFCRTMYVTKDIDPAWDLRDTSWHVVVEGDVPMDIDIRFPTENYGPMSAGINAHIAVNAVPAVCEATPGIRTTDDLRLVPNFK